MKLRATLAVLASLAIAAPALAQGDTFEIDNVHSQATFKVRHFFSKTPGRFNEMSGTIVYDAKDLTKSSVQVTIPTATINTENERRDGHLKSADFFDVEKHPQMTFKSTRIVPGKTKETFQIEGDLTIRGVTKKVMLDAQLMGVGAVAIGGQAMGVRAGFEATTKINRKDFGIVWNKALDQGGTLLGDDVDIELHVEAMKK
jgi:polyisoprenoid-binding protein YceI